MEIVWENEKKGVIKFIKMYADFLFQTKKKKTCYKLYNFPIIFPFFVLLMKL